MTMEREIDKVQGRGKGGKARNAGATVDIRTCEREFSVWSGFFGFLLGLHVHGHLAG